MTFQINIQAIANQQFTCQLDEDRYILKLKEANGVMVADVTRNDVVIVQGTRVLSGEPIIPYHYLEAGNFIMTTLDGALPDWQQFGITQSLVFLTAAEIATIIGTIDEPAERTITNLLAALAWTAGGNTTMSVTGEHTRAAAVANSVPAPNTFNSAYWVPNNLTVTDNAAVAPDTTTTAASLARTVASPGNTYLTHTEGGAGAHAGQSWSFAVDLKAGSYSPSVTLYIRDTVSAVNAAAASFNLSTGVANATIGRAVMTPLVNGWYNCVISGTFAASVSGTWQMIIDPADTSGVIGDTILAWKARALRVPSIFKGPFTLLANVSYMLVGRFFQKTAFNSLLRVGPNADVGNNPIFTLASDGDDPRETTGTVIRPTVDMTAYLGLQALCDDVGEYSEIHTGFELLEIGD